MKKVNLDNERKLLIRKPGTSRSHRQSLQASGRRKVVEKKNYMYE